MVGLTQREFDFGRAFSDVFNIVWRNAPMLLALNACFWVVWLALQTAFALSTGGLAFSKPGEISPIGVVAALFSLLVFIFEFAFLNAIVSYLGGRDRMSQTPGFVETFRECFAVGARESLPTVAIFLLRTVAVYIAMFFLIVPGVILSLIWFVSVPARVNEGVGVFASFTRSAELTRNNRLVVFGLGIVTGIIMLVAFYAILGVGLLVLGGAGLTMGASAGSQHSSLGVGVVLVIGAGLLSFVGMTFFIAATAALPTAVYRELRRIKDGGSEVAQVFA